MTDQTGPKYPMGKVSRRFFENVIALHLGAKRADIAVGPANGQIGGRDGIVWKPAALNRLGGQDERWTFH